MKKLLLIIFVCFVSLLGYAGVICTSPKVCTEMASQTCGSDEEFFGMDECLECGCPPGEEEVADGSCCPTENVHTETSTGNKVCGDDCFPGEERDDNGVCCPSKRMLETDGKKKCCLEGEEPAAGICCKSDKVLDNNGVKECCSEDEKILGNLISDEELMNISGGAIKAALWYIIGSGITFLAGLFSGIVNPKSCNK